MLYHSKCRELTASSLFALSLSLALPVQAQDSSPEASPAQTVESGEETETFDDYHDVIYVTSPGVGTLDFLAGTSVMRGLELQRSMAGQVGDVLASLPGVSATSFAPGVSRPVLRGLQGERVRVLTDGLGAIDASNTSADHAVSIDPLTADRIEVLRGAAALLYGSSAIGGAVNVISRRIPLSIPDEAIHLDALAAADTAADLREIGGSLDIPLGSGFAAHVDGSWRETDDLTVPGYVIADGLRAELLAEAAEEEAEEPEEAAELRELAGQRGTLENSFTRTGSAGAGLAWIGDNADFGVSVGYYDTDYGIAERPGAGHHHEEGGEAEGEEGEEEGEVPVSIGLTQKRADLRGGVTFDGGFFESMRTRWGFSDYTHTEFEGDEVGTVFDVVGVEGRVELVQRERNGWSGMIGGQYYYRDFDAVGEEAFVPQNYTNQYALFALQEIDLGGFGTELAARFEHTDVEVEAGDERAFDAFSAAIGVFHDTPGGIRVGLNASRVERAPGAEELFADGPHIATQQFEVGDPDLGKESAWGAEAYVRGNLGGLEFALTGYGNWFSDYIYLAATGEEENELPVFRHIQTGADFVGLEGELSTPLYEAGGFSLDGEVSGSWVRATFDDGTPVPRIPPLSLRAALDADFGAFEPRVEVEWADRQDRVGELETPTDGFTLVNASLAWRPISGDDNLVVLAQLDNIFDVEARRHASFTKDFVPLAGRNARISVRLSL